MGKREPEATPREPPVGWALAAALGGVFLAFGAWFFGEVSKAFGGDEFEPRWVYRRLFCLSPAVVAGLF